MVTAETRKLAAIMFTDIVGFSRQMGADEARMLRVLGVHSQIIRQSVAEHHGHVIKTIGDAFIRVGLEIEDEPGVSILTQVSRFTPNEKGAQSA